ncbi:hypothetical protein CPB84DRAFT_1730771 [Gymnopilus junonius]|uniref:F-box domain-containing protein n=1 Tax=Gymnopilus junonius TaxID=109634 RepID=A0A9P5NNL1_GYMJU|nr:hypothetical protein CPB84DRAFT_1730771 [Gymnopilus junonius]
MSNPVVHVSVLSSSERASRLAPEIHQMILDNIRDSKFHLSNCSLVCGSWLHLCRYHLFNEVNFRSDFARFLSSSPHAAHTVAPYIRKVVIKGNMTVRGDGDFLIKSAFQLPVLRSLHVARFSWECIKSPLDLALGTPAVIQLSVLQLQSVSFASFKILADFFDSLSVLQDLSLDNISWDALGCNSTEDRCFQDHAPKQSSFKKLHLASCHNIVVLNWLLYGIVSDMPIEDTNSCRQFPRLVALSFPDILPAEANTFGTFLFSLGETLQHLDLGILVQSNDGRSLDGFLHHLSLSTNTNLKSIIIHQINLFQFPSHVVQVTQSLSTSILSPCAWIPPFISTIRSTVVQSVDFRMWFSNETQLDIFPWSDLSSALLKIGVPNLRFHISGIGRDTDLVEGWITKRIEIFDQNKTNLQFDFLG